MKTLILFLLLSTSVYADIVVNVNNYINKVPYVSDVDNYGAQDYFATPAEFLKKGGDCEDYALSKYFYLKKAGIKNLKLAYVMYQNLAHMVLIHNNLVLDNLTNEIKPLKDRSDLKVVYMFDEQHIYTENKTLSIKNYSSWINYLARI